jgi:hypothetical protein
MSIGEMAPQASQGDNVRLRKFWSYLPSYIVYEPLGMCIETGIFGILNLVAIRQETFCFKLLIYLVLKPA